MLRTLIGHEHKAAFADCKASAACSTGMGVVMDRAAKTFALPTAETAADIVIVYKERIPSGIYAANGDYSDYFEQYNSVAAGEFAPLYSYDYGEVFATDQYDSTIVDAAKGKRVSVGTDGKWKVATVTTVSSKYVFKDFYNDNGHKLAIIEVSDTPAANAAA